VTNQPALRAIIDRLNPATLALIKSVGPVVFGGVVGFFLPDSLFGSPAQANAVKNVIVRFGTRLADAFERNANLSAADVDRIVDELLNEEVAVDPIGHIHNLSCVELARSQNKNKWPRVRLMQAVERGMSPSPCCAIWLQKKLEKPAKAPKNGPVRSIAEAIDSLDKKEDRDLVLDWVRTLSPEDITRLKAVLDSTAEVRVLVQCIRDSVPTDQILALLENTSPRAEACRQTKEIGRKVVVAGKAAGAFIAVQAGKAATVVKDVAVKVDAEAAPLAEAMEAVEKAARQPPAPKKMGLGRWLKRTFGF
jgi:hypothetical protein